MPAAAAARMLALSATAAAAGATAASGAGATYTRTYSVTNDTFLSFFSFFTDSDPTHGFVDYVAQDDAVGSGMVQLQYGSTGAQILMSADRTNDTSSGRRSVRVQSNPTFTGYISIIDMEHMPSGCGTWPAFWSTGPQWPNAGEIDIIEGVNRQVADQTTLHTAQGCDQSGVDPASFTGAWGKGTDGKTNGTNCWVDAPGEWGNAGCGIMDDDQTSYGVPFNDHHGGTYATVWDDAGVRSWNWARGSEPADVAARSEPNPDTWGLPYARFEFGSSCTSNHFHDHQIVFDLTFCGDWAGGVFGQQCSDLGQSCTDYVGRAENVQESYWVLNYVDVWETSKQISRRTARTAAASKSSASPSEEVFFGANKRRPSASLD